MTEREQELMAALRSPVDVEREEAARAIRDEPRAQALIDALGSVALSDPDPTVRYFAVQTSGIGLDVLAAVLDRDGMQSVRREAARRLFYRAHESALAQRYLVAALHDADYEVRAEAFTCLDAQPQVIHRANLVPLLIQMLDDHDQAIRAHAAHTLGNTKALAFDALSRLRAILDEAHVELELREEVKRAIQRIEASASAKQRKLPR